MKRILFFLGWPEMLKLLSFFISDLRKDFLINVFALNKKLLLKNETIVLIAYSAGVIPLILFFDNIEKENKIEKIILISPAGTINRSFLSHCFFFLKELFRFSRFNKKAFIKIVGEIVFTFCKNPIKFIVTIQKIRKFKLEKELKKIEEKGIKIIKVHIKQDVFMFDNSLLSDNKNNKILNLNSGHFAIIQHPKFFSELIRELIKESN